MGHLGLTLDVVPSSQNSARPKTTIFGLAPSAIRLQISANYI